MTDRAGGTAAPDAVAPPCHSGAMPDAALAAHRRSRQHQRALRPFPTPETTARYEASPGGEGKALCEGAGTGSLYERLRSTAGDRHAVDPGLSGGLRAWLEDGVAAMGGADRFATQPLVVHRPSARTARAHDGTLRTGAGAAGRGSGSSEVQRARRAIVRVLFRLAITAGPSTRPFEDALAALAVEEDGRDVVGVVLRMRRSQRTALRQDVQHHADHIVEQWPPAAPPWLPRTADRLAVPLAGGRVILAATADLVLGAPSAGAASVCLVSVEPGPPLPEHGADRRFLSLLETVRSGAPPFRVATYYTGCGRLDVHDVTDADLASAVSTTLDATTSMGARRTAGGR
jgi:hypothetical protein